ncbi:SOS response-associated peptidase family protein [Sphingobium sp. B2]|uniref:SOS response-associated peptidase family protein n=1 Tax=Sphingobium sp. B2 TaxID=2583228 RepID=UPI0011A7264D|nr:SOS response-associated peptidase family protein [Sphingobium sp. B2]
MTKLIRCRGGLAEIASAFDAQPASALHWHGDIWPGERALVVTSCDGGRRLDMLEWGLPSSCFVTGDRHEHRETVFARDLAPRSGSLVAPDLLTRCLIVVEAVAYPVGDAGGRTRAWAGLWDEPLAAWAGVCAADVSSGCAGILIPANSLIAQVSGHMPMLLQRHDWQDWLEGRSPAWDLGPAYPLSAWYLEQWGESWSTGILMDDAEEDRFSARFKRSRGKVDPNIELGYDSG